MTIEEDVLAELVEWYEDVTEGGIGSRVVVVPVPVGWGRTTLLDGFECYLRDQLEIECHRVNAHEAPEEPGFQATWIGGLVTSSELVGRITETLRMTRPDTVAQVVFGLGATLGGLSLSTPVSTIVTLMLGEAAIAVYEMARPPGPVQTADSVAARTARASLHVPQIILLDDADALDMSVALALLTGLLRRADGRVLAVAAASPECDLVKALKGSELHPLVRKQVDYVEVPNAAMSGSDRRRACTDTVPNWPREAIDRLVARTRSLDEVHRVCKAGGAIDVAKSPDPIDAVDQLVDTVLSTPEVSKAAVFVAHCGGLLHQDQLMAVLDEMHMTASTTGLTFTNDVARLERPEAAGALRSLVSGHFSRAERRQLAEVVGSVAAALAGRDGLDVIQRAAVLRPIPILMKAGDLPVADQSLDRCADFAELLVSVADVGRARDLVRDSLDDAVAAKVTGPAIERLHALKLKLAAIAGPSEDDFWLAARIADPGGSAAFGIEARLWATILRLSDSNTRTPGIELARRLARELDWAVLGQISFEWRLELGTALAAIGEVDVAHEVLQPVLQLPEGDERRVEAERFLFHASMGGITLAIDAFENELQATAEDLLEERLRITSVLVQLYDHAGLWRLALPHAREEVATTKDLFGPDHPKALLARSTVAALTGASGDGPTARDMFARLVPDLERVLGRDHWATLDAREEFAKWTGNAGDAATARDMLARLVPVMERALGRNHPNTLHARAEFARWTGDAGDSASAQNRFAQLVSLMKRELGPDHSYTLLARGSLARWTADIGDVATARDMLVRLVPDMERVFGPDHPDTLSARANLATDTGNAGDAVNAREMFAQLVPDMTRVLGRDHWDTFHARAEFAIWTGNAGDLPAARDIFAKLVPEMEQAIGCDHPATLVARKNFAISVGNAGDMAAGHEMLVRLLSDYERVLGRHHPYTLTVRWQLAVSTVEVGDTTGARSMLAEVVPDMERVLGADHPDTILARKNLKMVAARVDEECRRNAVKYDASGPTRRINLP